MMYRMVVVKLKSRKTLPTTPQNSETAFIAVTLLQSAMTTGVLEPTIFTSEGQGNRPESNFQRVRLRPK